MRPRGILALAAAALAAVGVSHLQLGGAARIRAIRNITVAGCGETAYMTGGRNISASPDAPQKWVGVLEYEKTIDLEHRR